MKLDDIRKLCAEGHLTDWRFETGEFEDCWWEVTGVGYAGRYRVCKGESNQWAGRFIAQARATLPNALPILDFVENITRVTPEGASYQISPAMIAHLRCLVAKLEAE